MRIMFLNQSPRSRRNESSRDRVEALLRSYASPGTEVDLCYPDDVEGGHVFITATEQNVHTELPYAITAPALIRKAVWAEQNGYDAVIQSNNFDPGVEASRLAVRIPVIGLCRTTLTVASTLADRVGITVPFDGHARDARRLVRLYGMEHLVTDIRTMSLPGFDVPHDELVETAAAVMHGLIRDTGAECIVPLGGAVIPNLVAPEELEREVGVPVLNTKAIGIHYAEMCIALGLLHSLRTYPVAKLRAEDFATTAFAR